MRTDNMLACDVMSDWVPVFVPREPRLQNRRRNAARGAGLAPVVEIIHRQQTGVCDAATVSKQKCAMPRLIKGACASILPSSWPVRQHPQHAIAG